MFYACSEMLPGTSSNNPVFCAKKNIGQRSVTFTVNYGTCQKGHFRTVGMRYLLVSSSDNYGNKNKRWDGTQSRNK